MQMLVATGGARHSTQALWIASELAAPNTEVTILTVIRTGRETARGRTIAEEARTFWLPDHGHVTTKVRTGKPAEAIVQEAASGGYDLLVIGERSPHRLRTRLVGSVVAHVAAHAPCPVLIAKGVRSPAHRILICDSGGGSPSVITLFGHYPWAMRWAENGEVTVLHVMSQITAAPGVRGEQLRADATDLMKVHSPEGELLADDRTHLHDYGIDATVKVRHGLVREEVLAEADAGGYGLIVIGAHRRSGWQSFLLSDLAQQIISHADRSVLLLR